MPIYEYQCVSCHHRFELKQGFDAEPTESCPACGGLSRRKFHAPTVIYKGSGFYTTDYARKGQLDPPQADGESGSDGATSDGNGATSTKEKETSSKED